MKNWEIQASIKGYLRRGRVEWHIARWHAWWCIHNGMVNWEDNNVRCQKDMITFPWEKEEAFMSKEDEEELLQLMQELNKGE